MTLSSIRNARFAAVDFESAGTDRGETDQPIQVGLACWCPTEGVGDLFVSYIQTNRPVRWTAQKVHGISSEDLRDAPAMHELWPDFRKRLDSAVVVAHSKGTEKRFLRAFPGHGFGPWLDTLILSRAVWPELPSHSLQNLCHVLSVDSEVHDLVPGKSWHDALFDAVASLVLLRKAVEALHAMDRPVLDLIGASNRSWSRMRNS